MFNSQILKIITSLQAAPAMFRGFPACRLGATCVIRPLRLPACHRPAHVAGVAQVVRVARPVPGLIELIKGNREGDAEAAVQGAEVNDMDEFGSTPLILAAQRDWAQVVAELLGCPGVDPNHQNLFGSTALICAAANGYISTLNELLKDERVDLEA